VAVAFTARRMARGNGWRRGLWFAIAVAILVIDSHAIGGDGPVAGAAVVVGGLILVVLYTQAIAIVVSDIFSAPVFISGAIAISISVGTFGGLAYIEPIITSTSFGVSLVFLFAFVNVAAVALPAFRASQKNWFGAFWLVFWPIIVGLCYLLLWRAARLGAPQDRLLFLVMVGLVPLVNIPFDWASIGVTRALLRRGCEPDAPSPFLLGMADFGLGLLLLGLLAVALLTALLAADHVTARAGVAPLIDLSRLFHSLAVTPGNAANWWVYLTLFSTMLPSVLNCLIGAVSLISWSLPSLRRWMLEVIPTLDQPGLGRTRNLVLLAFGAQVFFGTLLTGGALLGFVQGAEAIAPFALSDLLAGAEVWVRALSATGHV